MLTSAALIALFAVCMPGACRDLPAFSYPTTEQAREHWQPQFGSLPARVETDDNGQSYIALDADFKAEKDRACWDWIQDLDLSQAGRVAFDISSTGTAHAGSIGIFFGTPNGWYARFWWWGATNDWTPMVFPLEGWGEEGKPDGWDKVTKFRFSVWSAGPGKATYRLRNLRVLERDPCENFIRNGSFEITGAGMPIAWGSGHWGVGSMPWAADMDLWRSRWKLDTGSARDGTTSLLIDNQPDLPLLRAVSAWHTPPGKEGTLTLSAWIRSDAQELPVVMQCGGKSVQVKAGPDWAQFALSGIPRGQQLTVVVAPQSQGKMWLDAVQLQGLDEPTPEFHPAFTDEATAMREARVDWGFPRRTPEIASGRSVSGPITETRAAIDEHGRFTVNGEPYVQHSLGLEFVDDLAILDFAASSGFKDVCCQIHPNVTTERLKEIMDRSAAVGMRVIPWLDGRMTREQFSAHIQTLKDHPGLLCWYVYDEPSGERFAEADARYRLARELDPNHPALINYLPDKLTGHTGDIYSTDVYPIPHSNPMSAISAVRSMRADAPPTHPVWMWLQGTGYAYWMDREPTPRELSCMVYGSLIEGARGIYYFAQIPRTKECFDEMRAMCVEVDELSPFLYSLEEAPEVTADSPSILVRAYRHQGVTRVVAVNAGHEPVRPRIDIGGVGRRLRVVFEGREVTADGNGWSDDFAGYERHVYEIVKE